MPFDAHAIRRQFPILGQCVGGHPLVYLDNAATTQKPYAVLDAIRTFYERDNANVHRGMHQLGEQATVAYEDARSTIQQFLHAKRAENIIFTKSCTEAINIVARCWGKKNLKTGDVVVLTTLEHHSNIVPWLQLKEKNGIELRWVDMDAVGLLHLDQLEEYLRNGNVKLVSITGQSNVLGVRPPLEDIVPLAHRHGALVCMDAAQLAGHHTIDAQKLDCDFLAFSGHKVYGPMGIGILYGKAEHLEMMDPWLGGGMMIQSVEPDCYISADIPARFEGGTPPVADAVGLAAAVRWLSQYPRDEIEQHERSLLHHAAEQLRTISGLHLLGPWKETKGPNLKAESFPGGCLSFTLDGIHPHDLTHILGQRGICLRAGHHCTQPLHRRLGISASTRLSVAMYNTMEEIDTVIPAIQHAQHLLRSQPPF